MPAPNYSAILKNTQGQSTKAVAPTIKAMQGEKAPLLQRYQSVLDQITGNQQAAISGQQQVTSREFGARGIPLSSGVFGQTMEEKLNPIRREYSGLLSQTAAEREQSVADLMTRIAGVRTGALQSGISSALSLYGTKYGGYQSALDRQFQAQQAINQRNFKARQAEKDRANQIKAASSAAASGGLTAADFLKLLQGSTTTKAKVTTKAKPKPKPKVKSTGNPYVDKLLSQGQANYAKQQLNLGNLNFNPMSGYGYSSSGALFGGK